jgi:hypothetical protein
MVGLQELDARVKAELEKYAPAVGIDILFREYASPGQGDFEIKGVLNGADLRYTSHLHLGTKVVLEKNGDVVAVRYANARIDEVKVNDRTYYHPDSLLCADADNPLRRQEIDEAIAFGQKAFAAAQAYIGKRFPGLLGLIGRYRDRTLLPADDRPSFRENGEVFAQFDLSVDD